MRLFAGFEVCPAKDLSRGGGELIASARGGAGGSCRIPALAGLSLRLRRQPFGQLRFRPQPLAPELNGGDGAVMEETIDGVAVQPQFVRHPVWIAIIHFT